MKKLVKPQIVDLESSEFVNALCETCNVKICDCACHDSRFADDDNNDDILF